jgi:hypothetical protein
MAKKRTPSFMGAMGEAVGDIVDAASVAATGSQLGVLELAAEDELKPARAKSKRKAKTARKKKKAAARSKTKTKKKTKKRRGAKRRRR